MTVKRVIVGGAAVATLAVILPAAVMAAQTSFALAVVGVLAVVGTLAWRWLPYMMQRNDNAIKEANQKEMNRHLAALKAEAKKNPIEQAEGEFVRRSNQYQVFKSAMEQIGGKVEAFGNKLTRTKSDKPGYDLTQETAAYEKMKLFYENRIERLKVAHQKLIKFKEKLEEARVKWEFQLDANDAIRAMNATDQEAKINEILTEVAFDSVQQEFDAVFAKLDIDAAEMNAQKALEFGKDMIIDVSAIHIPEEWYERRHYNNWKARGLQQDVRTGGCSGSFCCNYSCDHNVFFWER